MLSVVTMDVERSWQFRDGLHQLGRSLSRDTVVADRQVNIAESVPPGGDDIRAGSIDADQSSDTHPCQFRKGGVPLGLGT